MPKKSLSASANESGISTGDSSSSLTPRDAKAPKHISELSYADRKLRDLNRRLANCIDTAVTDQLRDSWRDFSSFKRYDVQFEDFKVQFKQEIDALASKLGEVESARSISELRNSELLEENSRLSKKLAHSSQKVDKMNAENSNLEKKLKEAKDSENFLKQEIDLLKRNTSQKDIELASIKIEIQNTKLEVKSLKEELTTSQARQNSENDKIAIDRAYLSGCIEEYKERVKLVDQVIEESGNHLDTLNASTLENIEKLREEFESELYNTKCELQKVYDQREFAMHNDLINKTNEISQLQDLMNDLHPKYENSKKSAIKLKEKVSQLKFQLEDLKENKTIVEKSLRDELQIRSDEVNDLRESFQNLMNEYMSLVDRRGALTSEVQTLETIIEGQEGRLKITGDKRPQKRRSSVSLTDMESMLEVRPLDDVVSSKITLNDWDVSSNYITLKNMMSSSASGSSLKNYEIYVEHNNSKELVYRFDDETTLAPNESINIWGAHSNPLSITENDIIVDGIDNWFSVDKDSSETPKIISVINNRGKCIAGIILTVNRENYKPPTLFTHSGPEPSPRRNGCVIC